MKTSSFKAYQMTTSPFRWTVSTAERADHPTLSGILDARQSVAERTGAIFLEAPSLQNTLCADIHGDLPLGLYGVPNCTIKGDSAILFTETGRLISEQNAGLLKNHDLLEQIGAAAKLQHTSKITYPTLLSLVSTCTDCFWHWMMDSLPKVFLAEECGYTGKYLIPFRNAPPSVVESLELIGIAKDRLIPHDSPTYHADTLFIPTYFSGFNAPHNAYFIRRYREWLCARISKNNKPPPRKIYVARKSNAKARRIINDAEVARLTEQHGYETVFFEDLPFHDQLTIASQSVSMVAPHGSGMTHMLFMKERSAIVELFPFKRAGSVDCYEKLAHVLHHSYTSMESTRDCGTDIEVDGSALQKILERQEHSQ